MIKITLTYLYLKNFFIYIVKNKIIVITNSRDFVIFRPIFSKSE